MRKLIGILLLLWISSVSASGGGSSGPAYVTGKHNYFAMTPAFVVNLRDGDMLRFMQVTIQMMSFDAAVIEALQQHNAPLRHEILLLLSEQDASAMYKPQQRIKVQKEALSVAQAVLDKYAGIGPNDTAQDLEGKKHPSSIQELYFTDLVIQ